MKTKFFFTFITIFFTTVSFSFANEWLKTVQSSGENNSGTTGNCVVALKNSDIIIGGHYKADNIIFDEISFKSISSANKLVSLDKRKLYIAKISDGKFVWAKTFGSKSDDDNLIIKMKADEENNIFILGSASNPISIDKMSINKTVKNGYAYLAKINSEGDCLWLKAIEHFNIPEEISFDVNKNGEIVVATTVLQNDRKISQDKIVYNRPGSYSSAVLIRFDANGECIWIKGGVSEGAGSASTAKSVLLDSEGNAYLAGEFMGGKLTFNEISIPFPPELSTTPACGGIFITKYDKDGICKFASNSGSNLTVTNQKPKVFSLFLSEDENSIFTIGRFSKEFIIWQNDGITKLKEVKNDAQSSYFGVKFDANGEFQNIFSGETRNCWVEIAGLKKIEDNYFLIGNFAGNLEPETGKKFVSTRNRAVSRQKFFPFVIKLSSNFDFIDCKIPEANSEIKINDFCVTNSINDANSKQNINIIAIGTLNDDVNNAVFGEQKLPEIVKGFSKSFIWNFLKY